MRKVLYCDSVGPIGSSGLLLLRLVMGVAFVLHGTSKIQHPLDWMGPNATMPAVLQALAALSEFGGGLALIAGLLTRLASLGITSVMVVALATVHLPMGHPFVGKPGGPSFELPAVYLACAIMFFILGPGKIPSTPCCSASCLVNKMRDTMMFNHRRWSHPPEERPSKNAPRDESEKRQYRNGCIHDSVGLDHSLGFPFSSLGSGMGAACYRLCRISGSEGSVIIPRSMSSGTPAVTTAISLSGIAAIFLAIVSNCSSDSCLSTSSNAAPIAVCGPVGLLGRTSFPGSFFSLSAPALGGVLNEPTIQPTNPLQNPLRTRSLQNSTKKPYATHCCIRLYEG